MDRKEAIRLGKKSYTVKKPCKHCGSRERYVSSYSCYECAKMKGIEKLNNAKLMEPYRTPEKGRKKLQKWREKNPSRYREHWLKTQYGMTYDEYETMLIEQNHVCKICKKKDTRSLAVDHCHDTGKIRGLLCFKCNTAIGKLFNEELLMNALDYLRNHK